MALLTDEQIREIEQREEQKLLQKELEKQRLREVEMKRKEEEQKAKENYLKQLRESHEPLVSMVESLNETNYLILQYQNPNGRISTYRFKSKSDTKMNDFWIGYDNEYNLFVSNGTDRRPIIFNNILGADIGQERIAEVVLIDGVVYQRMILEPNQIDINFQDKTTKTYKGIFNGSVVRHF